MIQDNLPMPRLQLVWEKQEMQDSWTKSRCRYEMVLDSDDVRSEDDKTVIISMGGTEVNGGRDKPPIYEDGKIETPFRDGVHIMNDSYALKLPAYVICGDVVNAITPIAVFKRKQGE